MQDVAEFLHQKKRNEKVIKMKFVETEGLSE